MDRSAWGGGPGGLISAHQKRAARGKGEGDTALQQGKEHLGQRAPEGQGLFPRPRAHLWLADVQCNATGVCRVV